MKLDFLNKPISRRDFLKLLGTGSLAAMVPFDLGVTPIKKDVQLGRITLNGIRVYETPDRTSEVLSELHMDTLLPLRRVIRSNEAKVKNRTWYELDGGIFVHSAYVQPVKNQPQKSAGTVPESGRVGEICVPFVDSFTQPGGNSRSYRLYYAAMFWVKSLTTDVLGTQWYEILDDRYHNLLYIPTWAMRLIPYSELAPINSEFNPEEKLITVDLRNQLVNAYQGGRKVFYSRVSSGILNREGGFSTPEGWYRTSRKRPCRHMAADESDQGTGFDLPGVPWVSYITSNGVAFHGIYWHNDFGTPLSHGCINMSPRAARWIYLWTDPHVPMDKYFYEETPGTQVHVFYQ